MGPRLRPFLAPILGLLLGLQTGCGYAVAAGAPLKGGARGVEVRPLLNRSSDPSLGAEVAAAIRRELARRGLTGSGGPQALIDGEARTEGASATLPGGATRRVALEVRARLTVAGAVVAERQVRRESDHLDVADALEGEARRAQALQRLVDQVARELVDGFEE
jgi:hypothetical protein